MKALPVQLLQVCPEREPQALTLETNQRLSLRIAESEYALMHVAQKGADHWIITYSGGKDSTAVVCLAFDLVQRGLARPRRIDVVYADTGVEIPILRTTALHFLSFLRKEARRLGLPIHCHVRTPDVRQRFWFLVLGKGYPLPHQRFRWCTRRLKVEPARDLVGKWRASGKACVMTGVRFNESRNRDSSLYATCRRGGECGQGLWFWQRKRLKFSYLAPIVNWRECDVWDFLLLVMSEKGWPTRSLFELYQKGQKLRFGCWTCTVVRQDRTMARLVIDSKNASLLPLLEFRNRIQELTSTITHPESRLKRRDGQLGRLKLRVRKKLYRELIDLQERTGLELITAEERRAIKRFWRNGK